MTKIKRALFNLKSSWKLICLITGLVMICIKLVPPYKVTTQTTSTYQEK